MKSFGKFQFNFLVYKKDQSILTIHGQGRIANLCQEVSVLHYVNYREYVSFCFANIRCLYFQ